ncbi:MAG: hypothetical protein KH333_09890 [Clostridium sp.]|nr:hypothetical protein [Clostridium sp.]
MKKRIMLVILLCSMALNIYGCGEIKSLDQKVGRNNILEDLNYLDDNGDKKEWVYVEGKVAKKLDYDYLPENCFMILEAETGWSCCIVVAEDEKIKKYLENEIGSENIIKLYGKVKEGKSGDKLIYSKEEYLIK